MDILNEFENESEEYRQSAILYSQIMDEIANRIWSIRHVLKGNKVTGYNFTDLEFLTLQTRKTLELMAFSTIITNHKEYQKFANFDRHYQASAIFRKIREINPDFFPIPLVYEPETGEFFTVAEQDRDKIMTEEILEIAYNKCGDYAHAINPFHKQPPEYTMEIFKEFEHLARATASTLRYHLIKLVNIDRYFFVTVDFEPPFKVTMSFARDEL